MRKTFLTICLLMISFVGTWSYKMSHPVNTPIAHAASTDTSWWDEEGAIPVADDDWKLDPEIPVNYIPVIGEDELYMEVDNDGNVIGYHHRTQMTDGTWVWEDVNPDIPDNYEPVDGLENVYKVTDENGNVKYLKYIRNKDDTYAFVEVDENGVELSSDDNDGSIPKGYIHVTGNTYAVYNENGVLIGYKQRIENEDGSYRWETCDEPKGKDGESTTAGSITSGISSSIGSYQDSKNNKNNNSNTNIGNSSSNNTSSGTNFGNSSGIQIAGGDKVQNSDGSYTETETLSETKTTGGWKITYETVITRTYSSSGKLLSTKKDGPYEVSKVQVSGSNTTAPDKSQIASTLSEEVARISNSVSFNTSLANELLTELNAERIDNGVSSLSMSSSSDVYKIAQLIAADMATYNHADYSSYLYGSVTDIMSRYGIKGNPSQNVWRTTQVSAADINTRFQTIDSSRKARMSADYTSVGIAIVNKNGYTYICEIYLN